MPLNLFAYMNKIGLSICPILLSTFALVFLKWKYILYFYQHVQSDSFASQNLKFARQMSDNRR